jgi:hypothetical protein
VTYLRPFLAGLAIGWVVVVLATLVDGELGGGLAILIGIFGVLGAVAFLRQHRVGNALVAAGLAIGAFPLMFASIAVLCALGTSMC